MNPCERIKQELDKASTGLQEGNEGLARVCARRAVAIGLQAYAEQSGKPGGPGDTLHQLRLIEADDQYPSPVREAAQRLLTPVTQRDRAPMSTDPIADARTILTYLERLS